MPAGYVPAPGHDPLVIDAADFVEGSGGGGDQYGYYAYIINVPTDQPADELFDLPIAVINCTAMPDTPIFLTESAECDPAPGVWFEATATDGTWLGACVSGGESAIAAGCTIPVPYDTTVVITEDEETVAPGYAPRDNPITVDTPSPGPPQGERSALGFVNLPVPAAQPTSGASGPVVEPTETPSPEDARPAHIHPGSCGALKRGDSIALAPLFPGDGSADATPPATPTTGEGAVVAEMSVSVIDMPLDELLASPHAINVHTSSTEMRAYLVCGAIGGPLRADGSLAVGLREERGSGYAGIAYLAPDPEDPERTLVWVFIAPALAEEEQATSMAGIGTPVATPSDR
ncbi:MAG: hypothetical protein IT336_03095 [Thermomicrobiales bacterium]|nr:hypothetical protein [Thermomicrobiales bacterium]